MRSRPGGEHREPLHYDDEHQAVSELKTRPCASPADFRTGLGLRPERKLESQTWVGDKAGIAEQGTRDSCCAACPSRGQAGGHDLPPLSLIRDDQRLRTAVTASTASRSAGLWPRLLRSRRRREGFGRLCAMFQPSEESPMANDAELINAAGKHSVAASSRVGPRRRGVAWPRGAHCAAQPLTVTNPRNASRQSGGVRFDG
jgi:hypothetical protein